MPLATIQMMFDSFQGVDDLWGVPIPRNYVSANVRRGKATSMDQPKPNTPRALKLVHFDLFGHANNPRMLDLVTVSFSLTTVLTTTKYTWVYTIKKKSEVFDVLKKFYADTAIICSKNQLCCFHRDTAGENCSAEAKKWRLIMILNPHRRLRMQNGRAEVQIRV